jgi:hypothetical protein
VRPAVFVCVALAVFACNDIRDFSGRWQGKRVGSSPTVRVGPGDAVTLEIDGIDNHGIRGRIAVDNLVDEIAITSVPGAEADALANLTFPGNPLRVFLTFAAVRDGNGDAVVLIALYDDDRVDVRLIRGGRLPLYAIFALERSP